MKRQDGMSLIAILITIPVVLILGAITIGLALGEHGLLNAKTYEEYNKKVEQQKATEEASSANLTTEDNSQANPGEEVPSEESSPEAAQAEAPAQEEVPGVE